VSRVRTPEDPPFAEKQAYGLFFYATSAVKFRCLYIFHIDFYIHIKFSNCPQKVGK